MENTVTTNAPDESNQSVDNSAGVDTQNTSVQEDTTQTNESALDNLPTDDVAVTKPAPKTQAQEAAMEKLNISELIDKQMQGKLSEKDIASLEKAGLSQKELGVLADAQKAVQLKNNDTLYGLVGGEKSYSELKDFAAEHLSDEEIDGYNMALKSGNMKLAEMAVLGLKAMHERANGKPAQERISADGGSSGIEGAYTNQQELIKDMNNRKYGRDPEFTNKVNSRRARSGF